MTEEDENATILSRIAHLTEHQEGDYPHVVHGVAQGEGELTNGLNGAKYWPSEEIKRAAPTLEGTPVYDSHGDNREQVGAVLRSAYQEGVGVVYEAGLEDAEVAEELSLGQREVSIETSVADDVDRHEDTDAAILRGWEYTGLATPEKGASEGNYTAPGDAGSNPAVAALSAGAIESALSDDAVSPESGQAEGMGGETTTDPDTMTENEDESPDVSALLERVDERDEQIEELESKLAEKEERIGELEDYGDEIEDVKESYASALAEDVDVFDEDDLVDKFTVGELREKFEAREDAALAETEPDVQSGGGEGGDDPEEEAELSADPETVKHRITALEGAGMTDRANELKAELEDA